ncbi:MAG: hypothetical protein H6708_04645 [Kofleriaceae bacterium]|nr:hypothetical protein [Kofleriaceae bacterium]
MGDTGAAGLGLLVVLHAEASLPDGVEDRRLGAHRDLFLLDLGLGRAARPDAIPVRALGEPGTVAPAVARREAWLHRQLAPFDGSLARAARFALALAAARTGVIVAEPVLGADPDAAVE